MKILSKVLVVAFAAASVVGLASCGEDAVQSAPTESGSSISGQFAGSGASSQSSAIAAWKSGFASANPDVSVAYDAKGSGGGRKDLVDGAVVFAGSDSPLKDEEIASAANAGCQGGAAFEVPVYVSPIAVVFNIEGVKSLNLDAETIAKIFDGKIEKWNDSAIAELNADVKLPDLAITTVHRSDESGTTDNFTDYLNKAANGAWRYKNSSSWPTEGGQSGKGSSGLVQVVQAAQGTIGYVDESQAGTLGKVAIGQAGTFVQPNAADAAKAVAASPKRDLAGTNRVVIDIDRTLTADKGYPLVLVSYDAVCSFYKDPKTSEFVKAWLTYEISEQGQAAAASEAGSAPLTADLRETIAKSIDAIK